MIDNRSLSGRSNTAAALSVFNENVRSIFYQCIYRRAVNTDAATARKRNISGVFNWFSAINSAGRSGKNHNVWIIDNAVCILRVNAVSAGTDGSYRSDIDSAAAVVYINCPASIYAVAVISAEQNKRAAVADGLACFGIGKIGFNRLAVISAYLDWAAVGNLVYTAAVNTGAVSAGNLNGSRIVYPAFFYFIAAFIGINSVTFFAVNQNFAVVVHGADFWWNNAVVIHIIGVFIAHRNGAVVV